MDVGAVTDVRVAFAKIVTLCVFSCLPAAVLSILCVYRLPDPHHSCVDECW